MSLTDAIDLLLTEGRNRGAKPFRLDLQDDEIDQLRTAGALEPKALEGDTSCGAYRGVRVYPGGRVSELLAQPPEGLKALHLPLR